jgi:hypothetical protein
MKSASSVLRAIASWRDVRRLFREHHREDLAEDHRPAVVHEVFVANPPAVTIWKFSMRFCCHPGSSALAHSGSVGRFRARRSTTACAGTRRDGRAVAEVRDALHRGGAGSDDADALVAQVRRGCRSRRRRCSVVPAAGVERVAAERLDSGHARQLRLVQEPVREHDEARADRVAAIGADDPARRVGVPADLGDRGLEQRVAVQVVPLAIAWQCARISGPRLYFSTGM